MKRALIIATVGGFLGQFELNNVKLLQELGYEVHYAANFDSNIYEIDHKKLADNHIVTHHIPCAKNPKDLKKHFESYKMLKDLIEEQQISLVHCHTPVGGILGRVAARFANRSVYVIYTAHGFHFYSGASWKNWVYYPIEYLAARWTDCLITINKEDYERSRKFLFRKAGYSIQIPGVGLDIERFRRYPQNCGESFSNKFRIVTIGEINRNKNLETVIRALKLIEHSEITYEIYGRGKSIGYIENVIKECELTDTVHCMGYCTRPEEVLQNADLFVFPSIREGLGMAALEALACGVPVVALDNRGTREYMRDGINGYVCANNSADEFAKKIEKAFSLYKAGEFREVFPVEIVSNVNKFCLHETEKAMTRIYEQADKSIRDNGCT